jgi:Domain of unknown function (DUF6531)
VGAQFWTYDPDVMDWYVYGHGAVTPNGKQVKPDPSVRLWEFTGAMFGGKTPADSGAVAGGEGDGDPVDVATGLCVLNKTDLVEPGSVPIQLTRTYRPDAP